MNRKNYLQMFFLLVTITLTGTITAQTKKFATQFVISNTDHVTSGSLAADESLTTTARVNASSGVAAGAFAYSGYIELTFPQTVAGNTPSYIKIKTEDVLLPALVGGDLSTLLASTLGTVLAGKQEFTVEAKLDAASKLLVNSQTAGAFSGDRARIVADAAGEYYIMITPSQDYNKIRITNRLGSLIGLFNTRWLDVYGAFYVERNNACGSSQFTSFNGASLVSLTTTGVLSPGNAIDASAATFSSLRLGLLAVGPMVEQSFYFEGPTYADDTFNIRLRAGQDLIDLNVASRISITAYKGGQVVLTRSLSQLLTLSLLNFSGGQIVTVPMNPGGAVDKITVKFTSFATAAVVKTVDIFGISRVANPPVITTASSITCPNASASITATTSAAGNELRWYTAPTGGTPISVIASGQPFITPPVTADVTYYVASGVPGCAEESKRTPQLVQVVVASTTWNGTAWSNGVPTFSTLIFFTGDYNLDADINGCCITVQNNAQVYIPAGRNVTINGSIVVEQGSSFTIENNSNLLQNVDIANTGNVVVKKNTSLLYRLDYTLWSSPVSGTQTLKNFSPLTADSRFYTYNTAQDFYSNNVDTSFNPLTQTFQLGKSYLIRMPNTNPTPGYNTGATPIAYTHEFTGVPNNGPLSVPVSTLGTRYNAIGNPYPSPINIHAFIDGNTASLSTGTLYFWRKKNDYTQTSYATITKFAYAANGTVGGDTGSSTFTGAPSSWVLNQGQGFFVQVAPGASAISYNNRMRRTVNNSQFFRNGENGEEGNLSRIWLNVTTGEQFGQAVIGYSDITTNAIDFGYDGTLLNDTGLKLYTSVGDANLSIQARQSFNDTDIVPLKFATTTAGSHTIAIDHLDGLFAEGQDIFIKDNITGTIHNLQEEGYTFVSEAGFFGDRFEIQYKNVTLATTDVTASTNNVIVWKQDNALMLNSNNTTMTGVTVYDMRGRMVYGKNDISTTQMTIDNLTIAQQVLIVEITTPQGKVSKKIVF